MKDERVESKSLLKREAIQGRGKQEVVPEGKVPVSFAPEVLVQGEWSRNGLRFATEEEAKENALDLMSRWTLVQDSRATPSEEPVNYRWDADTRTLTNLETGKGYVPPFRVSLP